MTRSRRALWWEFVKEEVTGHARQFGAAVLMILTGVAGCIAIPGLAVYRLVRGTVHVARLSDDDLDGYGEDE